MFFGRDSELDRLASLWRKRVWGEKVLRLVSYEVNGTTIHELVHGEK